jgi:phytoene dehydrogenase-like protein
METYDVIVLGAGFGGATCAALLARRGLRVLLIEKNARAGGKAMVVEKNGFTYELWPVIHAPARESRTITVLRELGLEDTVDLVYPSPRGAIYVDPEGRRIRFPDPAEATADPSKVFDVIGVPEAERPQALALLTELALMPLPDVQALDEVSFDRWLEEKGAPRPVRAYLNALANGVFMVPSDMLPASEGIRTLQEILMRHGGLYCRTGGIGRLAEVYAGAVEANGGRVLYRTRVRRIRVEKGRVTGVVTDKGTFAAPLVVSNVGLQPTVLKLVGEQHFDRSYVNRVKDLTPSWGMMGVRYFLDARILDEPYYLVYSDQSYWTTERWMRAAAGHTPQDVIMWVQVPAANDPALAPPGKQCVLTGVWCSPDPATPAAERERWWRKVDEMMERTWPGFRAHVAARETYDTHDVAALSRTPAFPGVGGECIGLGQVIGQCGRTKPAAQAPIRGLFYVGADAGGWGCGTHQAVESGIQVADLVLRVHRQHQALAAPRVPPAARARAGGGKRPPARRRAAS